MTSWKRNLLSVLIGCGAAVAAVPALSAYDFVWSYYGVPNGDCLAKTTGGCNATNNDWGNTRAPNATYTTPGAPALTAQAWSDTGMPSPGDPNARTLATAYLPAWSGGLGVQNRDLTNASPFPSGTAGGGDGVEGDNPEHAMDNNQRFDAVLFSFGSDVKLEAMKIGWKGADSDITILAYDGAVAPLAGKGYTDLVGAGWQVVGNYADLPAGSGDSNIVTINSSGVTANYWLILGYNPAFAGASACASKGSGDGCDYPYVYENGKKIYGDDYVKILALYANKQGNGVPEPSALLLLGIGLTGLWATRRRLRA